MCIILVKQTTSILVGYVIVFALNQCNAKRVVIFDRLQLFQGAGIWYSKLIYMNYVLFKKFRFNVLHKTVLFLVLVLPQSTYTLFSIISR